MHLESWFGGVFIMLHHRIVELRKSKKITQEGLANKIGVSRSALSQYELGSRQPDYEIIKRMADFFDVSIDYLLGRTSDPKRILKEQSRRLIDMIDLDLTDEEIMSKMDLYVDGQIVEEQEVRIFIDLVRGSRLRMKQGLASTESKQ